MTDEDKSLGFALPPFDPALARVAIGRALRDMKLNERGDAFEQRGKRVAELKLVDGALDGRIARKLALTPEWDRMPITSAAEQRKFVDEIRKRLQRWEHDE
jgi:hypothetical protein